MTLRNAVVLFLAAFFLAISASGQVSPDLENGFKHWGSYEGSNVDSVNNLNGNPMLHGSLLQNYSQRGGLSVQDFVYQTSKTWQVECQVNASGYIDCWWTTQWQGVGLQQSVGLIVKRTLDKFGSGTGTVTYSAFGYTIVSQDGSTHQFFAIPGTADSTGEATKFDSIDGTGYHLELSSGSPPDTATVTDRHGNQYVAVFGQSSGVCSPMQTNHPPSAGGREPMIDDSPMGDQYCPQAAYAKQVTDANGNRITFGPGPNDPPSTAAIDTLGRTLPLTGGTLTSDYSGCGTSHSIAQAYLVSYSAPDGSTRQMKLCQANINIQTAFNVPGVREVQYSPNGTLLTVQILQVVTIALADGTQWTFDYDSYGEMTSVGLPTGGSITYTWTTIGFPSCSPNGGNKSRAVITRTLTDNNGHSSTWTYNWGTVANSVITNTVTDPLLNDTVHVFTALGACGFYETQTKSYQGTGNSRQLLKQIHTTYSSANFTVETGDGVALGNVQPTSIQTTIYPSGKVSKVTRTYDSGPGNGRPIFGNLVTEKQYDWGQGAPGPLLREIDNTYQWQVDSNYLTANLIDLPASVIVKDGSGCTVTKTTYGYDETVNNSGLQAASITTQHFSPPGPVRGNQTSVNKYLWTLSNGSCASVPTQPSVVSHAIWYDTGEVYQTIDPLGHTSTHSYHSDYVGAYSTKTCNALNQCVTGTYDFNTGVLTSLTDANATQQAVGNIPGDTQHTSNFSYDYLFRITSAQAPPDPSNSSARAQTSFTFSAPNTFPLNVQRQKSITNSLNDSATAYFDGLGRPYQTQHVLPDGTAKVDTTYDGASQVSTVSNPYFATSDTTYGTVQSTYDGLGRVTQSAKQDGGVSTVAYDVVPPSGVLGNCATSTDEAGKQRRGCNDALGRLVEVDEVGDSFPGSQSSGSLGISGSLQSVSGVGAHGTTTAAVQVTIGGTNHYLPGSPPPPCDPFQLCDNQPTPPYYDNGKFYIVINGHEYDYWYGGGGNAGDDTTSVAAGLVNAIQADGARLVNASVSGSTITLTARSAGSAGNSISFTTGSTWDTSNWSTPSFTASPASGNLSGGSDGFGGTTVYDAGTVSVTVGTFNASVSYSQSGNSTAALVAFALVTALNGSSSPVTASASGSSVSMIYKTLGPAGNISVSCSSSTSQAAYFSGPSFACPAATALTSGENPSGPSLNHNFFVTQYAYDGLGNLLTVTQKGDPALTSASQWRVRTFSYDSLGRLLTANNPESGRISYVYDNDGNLLSKISPQANQAGTATTTVSYCYDALHRVTAKGYTSQSCPLTSPVVTYVYDQGANGIGHLSSLTDQAGSASYSYDVLGRLVSEQRTTNGVTKSIGYSYNLDGSMKTLTYPSGAVVTYTPDSAGRALSAADTSNNINYVTGATYGPDSALTGFKSGHSASFDGITNTFSFNKRLQPVNMSATSPTQTVFSIGYDFHLSSGNNGNVWGITNYRETSRNQSFTYDALNRLTSAQNAGTDCSKTTVNGKTEYWGNNYSYDAWGNLLNKTVTKCSAENLSLTADIHNWIHTNATPDYAYDAAGNMTHDATSGLNYSFDQENRITGAGGYSYIYDADGNRVNKSNGATGILYWYMTPGIVAESDLAGALKSEYVFFDGERVARKDFPGNAVSYYFSDHLKTASVITDSAGTIKAEADYYPWGGELQFANNDSNHYKFTGKERDAETGLDYFGARYYSNPLGRFLIPDWAGKATAVPYAEFNDPQSLNLYSYVRNVPTTRLDSDGHCSGDECGNVKVSVSVTTDPTFKENRPEKDGTYRTGVRGQLTITLTQNGKPMAGVPVKEKVTQSTTVNGTKVNDGLTTAKKPVPTNNVGKVKDDVSREYPTPAPVSSAVAADVKNDLTTNATAVHQQQTLTFPGQNGATCSATYERTLTNVDNSGNVNPKTDSSGSNYTLTTTQPKVKAEKP